MAISEKNKKLSSLSVILIIINSSISAGVFFKYDHITSNISNLFLCLLPILLIIMIMLLMSSTFKMVCSPIKNNNDGVVGWGKFYCNKFTYNFITTFNLYILIPIIIFIVPIYSFMFIQEAFGFEISFYWIGLIGLAITLYFIVFVGRKNKYGNIHNIIFISIKFCVIIFVIVAGIIIFSTGHYTHSEENSGINISNTLGIINCLPGVMFLLKLFYSCPGLENKLEKKESFSRDLLIGISVASAILFILSIFMVFCTVDGSIDTLQYYFNNGTGKIIMRIVLVAVGIFSLAGVNSYAIYINEFYGEMVKNNTLIFSKFFNKIARNKSTNTVGIYPLLTLYLILFLIFIPLGGLINLSYTKYNVSGFGADNLYCMTDFLGNWTSSLTFLTLSFTIFGCCLKNKKINIIIIFGYISVFFIWCIIGWDVYYKFYSCIKGIVDKDNEKFEDNGLSILSMFVILGICITFSIINTSKHKVCE